VHAKTTAGDVSRYYDLTLTIKNVSKVRVNALSFNSFYTTDSFSDTFEYRGSLVSEDIAVPAGQTRTMKWTDILTDAVVVSGQKPHSSHVEVNKVVLSDGTTLPPTNCSFNF